MQKRICSYKPTTTTTNTSPSLVFAFLEKRLSDFTLFKRIERVVFSSYWKSFCKLSMLRFLLSALTVFFIPVPPGCTNFEFEPYDDVFSSNGDQFTDDHESEFMISNGQDYDHEYDHGPFGTSDHDHDHQQRHIDEWFEEQLEDDLKWSFALNGYIIYVLKFYSNNLVFWFSVIF